MDIDDATMGADHITCDTSHLNRLFERFWRFKVKLLRSARDGTTSVNNEMEATREHIVLCLELIGEMVTKRFNFR